MSVSRHWCHRGGEGAPPALSKSNRMAECGRDYSALDDMELATELIRRAPQESWLMRVFYCGLKIGTASPNAE